MISRALSIVAIVLSIVHLPALEVAANDQLPNGTVVDFVVPAGSPFSSGGDDVVVFTGRADGVVAGPSTCSSGTQNPLQSAIGIFAPPHGAGQRFFNVIVVSVEGGTNPSPIAPGTRLGSIQSLGICGTSGEYDKYRGVVK